MKHSTTRLDPKGIHFDKVIGKFVVQVKAGGKRKTMRFDTLEKAKAALAAEPQRIQDGYYWVRLGADPAIIARYDYARDQWQSLEWSLPVGANQVVVLSEPLTAPAEQDK